MRNIVVRHGIYRCNGIRNVTIKRGFVRLSHLALGLILLPASGWACAVCTGANDAITRGLTVSVLFLMSMPFLIAGVIFGVLIYAQKGPRGLRLSLATIKSGIWPIKCSTLRQKEANK